MDEQTRAIIHHRVFGEDFNRAVFSGVEKGLEIQWQRVVIRPVLIRGERYWQFAYFDEKKDVTKNYLRLEAGEKLDQLLNLPFRNVTIEAGDRRLEVRLSKKGKMLKRESRNAEARAPDLEHDHRKIKLLTPENAGAFLQAVEITTFDGRVRSEMQSKLRQINEFVRLVDETDVFERWPEGTPVRAVDLGCGKGYLTFALYHYLTVIRGLETELTGVDLKSDLLAKLEERRLALGWAGLRFVAGTIQDYVPEQAPEIVVALHACDTASDDALAKGLRWGSRLIVTAPCCQHYLQAQMAELDLPEAFEALMRHGILFERMGDLITDSLRAAYLRALGYRTEVIQFTPLEHTAKNLMIRAVKTGNPSDRKALDEYRVLKEYWGVTPYLEALIPIVDNV